MSGFRVDIEVGMQGGHVIQSGEGKCRRERDGAAIVIGVRGWVQVRVFGRHKG
jgi:hypothetical protein